MAALGSHIYVFIVGLSLAVGFAVAAARADLDTRRLPNKLVGLAAVASWGTLTILWLTGAPEASITRCCAATAVIAGPFAAVWFIRPELIGGGDLKLAFALAPLTAWPAQSSILGVSMLALTAMFILATPQALRTKTLAFGPYIIAGIGVAVAANLIAA